ncbi:MAG TPA: tetratricopeptide repeat protein [Candidatus Tectomicrobia bacterium]|nr:tetratricopeptide repeat protein [Candidatus Tectomicrobia bacterium]
MSRPVKSLLHPKLSAICEASPRRRHPTVSMSHRTNASTRLPSARLLRWARCARCMGLVVMWLAVVVGYPMATWGGEEEKQPLKLPEVVILGQDVSVLKEAKERLVPQELTPTLKEIPAEGRENIDLSTLGQAGKTAPQVSSPGCLFGNPVTGSIARAFLGDEAQYKVGLYRYQTGDYPGAIDAFSRVHQEYPQSIFRGSAYYWEGESYSQLGRYDKALAAYQQLIQYFPGDRLRDYALLSAADVHLRAQRPSDAIVLLRELLSKYPTSPIAPLARRYLGEALFHAGQYAEAADVYGQLLQARNGDRDKPDALFWRAESLYQSGAFEAAEQGYHELLQAYPRNPRREEALYGLGWAQLNGQKYRSALETLQHLERAFPRTRFQESLYYARVKAYLGLRQQQAAQDAYRQLVREFPRGKWRTAATLAFARAAYESGDDATVASLTQQLSDPTTSGPMAPVALVLQGDLLYREGKFPEAIEAYRRAERTGLANNLLETTLMKRAFALYQRRDFANAAADLERLLRQFPTSPYAAEAAFWLGESRFYNRQYRQALQAYLQVPRDSARYPDALYGRGWVHYQGNDWPKAVPEFEQVVRQYPQAPIRPEALYRLGEVQFNLKSSDKAIAIYQQLLREYPQERLAPNARFRIGWVRYKAGDNEQAIRDLSELVRQHPDHPIAAEAHYWLGMAHIGEKQLDEARAQFERVLALQPAADIASPAILRLGDTLYNQGKYTQAIDAYARLTTGGTPDAHTPDAEYGIILSLYQLRRLNEYATRARAFTARYPTHPLSVTVLYQLAELYEAENRPQLALETLQEVINRFGQGELAEPAHLRRAEIHARQGNWNASLIEAQQALSVARSDVIRGDALYAMARAQEELKLFPAAAESYRRLVQEYPKSRFVAASLRGMAQSLTQAGRKAEAKQAWQDLLQRASKDASTAEVSVELGLLLQSEGEHRQAIEQFNRAVSQGTPEVAARAQYEIGRTYTLLKDYRQGTVELMKVAYLYPQQQRWVQRSLFQAAANYEQEQKWQEALAVYQKIVKEVALSESREQAAQKIEQIKKKIGSGA